MFYSQYTGILRALISFEYRKFKYTFSIAFKRRGSRCLLNIPFLLDMFACILYSPGMPPLFFPTPSNVTQMPVFQL